MSKKILVLILLLFACTLAHGQTIRGLVLDENGAPVIGANVYFVSFPSRGVASDLDGLFALQFTHDNDTLFVSFVGYEPQRIAAHALSKENRNVIRMQNDPVVLNELVVAGATPISEQFSTKRLSQLDIYMNPISQGDPLKSILSMPASTNSDETANPTLRASDPDRSRVVYNGVPIYRPVRASSLNNIGVFSIFNTGMIDQETVYPSNPPLIHGNSSGGLVDIATIKKVESNEYQASLSLGSVGLSTSQRLKGNDTFLQLFGNYQNLKWMQQLNGYSIPDLDHYDTKDIGVNLRYTISDKLYINTLHYAMGEYFKGTGAMMAFDGAIDMTNRRYFTVNNLVWYQRSGIFSLNYGFNSEKRDMTMGNMVLDSKEQSHFLSVNYKRELTQGVMMQVGASIDREQKWMKNRLPRYYFALNAESPTVPQDTVISNLAVEPYLYLNWDLSSQLSFSAGARSNIPFNKKRFVSWQASMRYQPNDNHTFLMSGGDYHSYSDPNYFKMSYNLLHSRQLSLDYQYEKEDTRLESALYYKQEGGEQTVEWYYTINKLRSLGWELALSQTFWEYLTIKLANTTVKHDVQVDGKWYKGSQHFDYFLKSSISYSNPQLFTLSLYYIARPGTWMSHYPVRAARWNDDAKAYMPIYSEMEAVQNGNYHRLDLSLSKYMSFDRYSMNIFMSVNNLLNRNNEMNGIYYNNDYTERNRKYYGGRLFYFGVVFMF